MSYRRRTKLDRRPTFETLEERRLLATWGVDFDPGEKDLGEAIDGNNAGTLSWAILQARTDTDPSVRISLTSDVDVEGRLPEIQSKDPRINKLPDWYGPVVRCW